MYNKDFRESGLVILRPCLNKHNLKDLRYFRLVLLGLCRIMVVPLHNLKVHGPQLRQFYKTQVDVTSCKRTNEFLLAYNW